MKDSIEKTIYLDAPIQRIWRALTDHKEFGTWFRVKLDGPFEVDQITRGVTEYPGYEGLAFWSKTERMDEPNFFSFRWPIDENVEPDAADLDIKTTLVEFRLEEANPGTRLFLKESGFNALPEDRRLQAFRENEGGWAAQMENIRAYVEQ